MRVQIQRKYCLQDPGHRSIAPSSQNLQVPVGQQQHSAATAPHHRHLQPCLCFPLICAPRPPPPPLPPSSQVAEMNLTMEESRKLDDEIHFTADLWQADDPPRHPQQQDSVKKGTALEHP